MSDASTAGDPLARLHDVSDALVAAYRARCQHPESAHAARCSHCENIAEVLDMIRCAADSAFEASALRAHFQQELRALLGHAPLGAVAVTTA
ncbi:hypothetical protein [Leucobacter luti]|uniref:Uncharacterized protein n=1 Tax=Leucobacter luti TaxID=340320 RepID=A0A4Q7TPS0_9MICO|nr:hypothetical protein [Leucobacter luti]MBL3699908.1 hypothetical protein [Leucobacter luti]RZT62774.1 hypothetical protein EV139_2479 [Leucobacter luti]